MALNRDPGLRRRLLLEHLLVQMLRLLRGTGDMVVAHHHLLARFLESRMDLKLEGMVIPSQ
jgi:hypothetical protein